MKKVKVFVFLFYFFLAVFVFGMGGKDISPGNDEHHLTQALNTPQSSQTNQTRAEQVMKALHQAYPRQIDRVEFRNGDWAVLLRGTWYYYAGGRLLPQNLLQNAANYNPHPFYNYQVELPPWRAPDDAEQERLRNLSANRNRSQIRRSPAFFDDLWRARNRNEAYDRVKTMRFLGKQVTVHFMIMEVLALIEEEIFATARKEPQVQTWINNISELAGWSWRNIADTGSRSYHSYGLAIDIIPRSYGGRETYWLWTQNHRADWWNVPYSGRWHPPAIVIKTFEKYGFIWGGKWLFYDTMHFEYRPEILILAGIPPETRR